MICSSGSVFLLGVGLLSLSANAALFSPDWNSTSLAAWMHWDKDYCQKVGTKMSAFLNDTSKLGTWQEEGWFDVPHGNSVRAMWWNAHVPSAAYDDTLDAIIYCQKDDYWSDQGHFEDLAASALCDLGTGIGDARVDGKRIAEWDADASFGGCSPSQDDRPHNQEHGDRTGWKDFKTHCGCKMAKT